MIEVTIQLDKEQRLAVVSVQDQGLGIPADQQQRLFQRFARAHNTQGIIGVGLGLYLCRELVERHGGRIWFESIEVQGSTFFIALPSTSLTRSFYRTSESAARNSRLAREKYVFAVDSGMLRV
jgi:signal transduction histidine kinase